MGPDDESTTIHLCDIDNLPDDDRNIKYATLSHCWGGILSKELVKESIHDFHQGIRLTDLPKTFREAVHVTRKIGIKYLWVDALCVIQDSRKGWLQESSKMGEIYAGSYVNLAATASADSSGGLFRVSNPLVFVPCQILVSRPDQAPKTYVCRPNGQFHGNVNQAPLNSRAWVFQERALAPRIVHFAKDQLYWQCSSMVASRCFPRGTPSELGVYNIRAWRKYLVEATDPIELDYSWRQVIMYYTRGNLTNSGDKLVALSGLAKEWGQARGFPSSSYLAGLWEPHLPYYLCWFTRSYFPSTRPAQYRAPSWSWASIDGQIQPSGPVPRANNPVGLAQVVAAQTTLVNTTSRSSRSGGTRNQKLLIRAFRNEACIFW